MLTHSHGVDNIRLKLVPDTRSGDNNFVQYLKVNVIFPIAVSGRLNVNMLVMLIAIFSAVQVGCVGGMILSVSCIAIVRLIHN